MRAALNGRGTGARVTPWARKKERGLPLGDPPRAFTKSEKAAFNQLRDEWAFADRTHRRFIIHVAKVMAKLDRANNFFRRRRAEFVKQGKEPALAYLTDDGERHPRMTALLNAEAELAEAFPIFEKHKAEVEAATKPVTDDPSGALRYFR